MTLAPGLRLGPYEIGAPLGAGGMGEVYRARDTRLGREVAVKVLPAHLAGQPQLRQRLEREARAISSLNHPHICALYDVGHQDGVDFLVMEHVEGETLARRLERGALPPEAALRCAIEICDALAAAHQRGVVHRDLKPGNVMLTRSGAKLLDFGLAKLARGEIAAGAASQLPTFLADEALTAEGAIVGTFQYMAPEQLEGREVDPRTDIFALGAMLYEMVTGRKAFEGTSQASLIAAILDRDPPPASALQPLAPQRLDRVLQACLAKDPDDRWQSARDLARELRWTSAGDASAGEPRTAGLRGRKAALSAAAVGVLVGAALAGATVWIALRAPAPPPREVARFTLAFPADEPVAWILSPIALSPDGRTIASLRARGDTRQLFLRSLERWEESAVPGSEGAVAPFFSPDGRWIGLFAQGRLKKAPLAGGTAVSLCDAANGMGATWGDDGAIVFAPSEASGLLRIADSGGSPRPLTELDPDQGELSHRWPEILPGGNAALFTIRTGMEYDAARIAVVSLASGERHTVLEEGSYARYSSTGHLIYLRGEQLFAAPFDRERLRVTGPSALLLEGVEREGAPFALSASGSLLYLPSRAGDRSLTWVDRRGAEEPTAAPLRPYSFPSLSPDGSRLAVTLLEGQQRGIWLLHLGRGVLSRVTSEGFNHIGIWTPDSQRVIFSSDREGTANLYWQSADGSGAAERLVESAYHQDPGSCSPDGEWLAYAEVHPTTKWDLWVVPLREPRTPRVFRQTPYDEFHPMFSPDGRWLAYTSDESGRNEVYVEPFPGPGSRVQVSTAGGVEPLWSPHGRELFFRDGLRVMAVDVRTEPAFEAGAPQPLFEERYLPMAGLGHPNYEIAPDGRFLMIKEEASLPTELKLVVNWVEELESQLGPGGR